MKRRDFLRNSITTATLAGLGTASLSASAGLFGHSKQEYYELRVYRLKPGASRSLLDAYLAKAALPALNRLGAKNVGVFNEIEPKDPPSVFVLIP
jgi:hypothetical protein